MVDTSNSSRRTDDPTTGQRTLSKVARVVGGILVFLLSLLVAFFFVFDLGLSFLALESLPLRFYPTALLVLLTLIGQIVALIRRRYVAWLLYPLAILVGETLIYNTTSVHVEFFGSAPDVPGATVAAIVFAAVALLAIVLTLIPRAPGAGRQPSDPESRTHRDRIDH